MGRIQTSPRPKRDPKCDAQLDWWISLANLYRREITNAQDPIAGKRGFADDVRSLSGVPPEAVAVLLSPAGPITDSFVGFGNNPDKSLWGLAGVTRSLLTALAERGQNNELSGEIVILDWSNISAPLILKVSGSGVVEQAYRPEPLANDLLGLLRNREVSEIGTCPICGRLFRRVRKDQKCDTTRCRDVLRQQRHRASRPRYEANRRRYKKSGFKAKETIKLASSLRRDSGK